VISLRIDFLAGRFHASPWDKAVNEGDVEWPPSPWRILRAIIAGWFHAGATDQAQLMTILDRLATPPRFLLPPWSVGHSRHYMPQGTKKGSGLETSLVIDAFVAFRDDASSAYVVWDDAVLTSSELEQLRHIVSFISYFGRAESWCEVSVAEELPKPDPDLIAVELASRSNVAGMPVRRLGAAADMRGRGLFESLLVQNGDMRRAGRRFPLGSTWFEYNLPNQRVHRPIGDANYLLPAHVERFVLEGPSSGLLPPITETLTLAEMMRAAAMKNFSNLYGEIAPPMLSGKSIDGGKGLAHRHAYFLPVDLNDDGKIDHIDVYFPADYDHTVHRAVLSVQSLWGYGIGLADGQRYSVSALGRAPIVTGRIWDSRTPFVLDRHPRRRVVDGVIVHRDTAEEQIRKSLEHHGFSTDVEILVTTEPLFHKRAPQTRLDIFRRVRKRDPMLPVVNVRLVFAEPQSGPIALGRYAHFGLGQFQLATNHTSSLALDGSLREMSRQA
jgi:CRISPR-associated protein Csb2